MPLSMVESAKLKGLFYITPHVFTDHRGDYKKLYEKQFYTPHGIPQIFTETSEIVSNRGVLRGIHYQTVDSQAKLVHVIRGKIFDVAVDLRPDSPTFGQWESFLLTGDKEEAIFIPEDFAHGFLVLEDDTIFTYQCSGVYRPEYCGGLQWDDPELGIDWPLEGSEEVILSEKDKHNLRLSEYRAKVGLS